jgi:hypothetical protein
MATTEYEALCERLETICWTLESRLGIPHPGEPQPELRVIVNNDGTDDDE